MGEITVTLQMKLCVILEKKVVFQLPGSLNSGLSQCLPPPVTPGINVWQTEISHNHAHTHTCIKWF